MNEYQVPLVELLKSVPNDARFVQQEEFSSAYYPVGTLCHQAADRITELEKRHTTLQTQFDNLYELANSGDEMNTEPVAWLVQYPDRHEFRWKKPEHLYEALACEPLYTHPNQHDLGIAEAIGFDKGYNAAKPVDLTDEQILCLWDWWSGEDLATNVLDFADTYRRALLGEAGLVKWHQAYVKKMNEQDPAWKATQE